MSNTVLLESSRKFSRVLLEGCCNFSIVLLRNCQIIVLLESPNNSDNRVASRVSRNVQPLLFETIPVVCRVLRG